ncbi:MAG: hypothetical protein LC126_01140 [Bryobacterales bacterium]|nr:hypothetical protein [Bryobacterales bacterium]MCZ2146363.1 hypothetical protein [Bryobacterales bacterium]
MKRRKPGRPSALLQAVTLMGLEGGKIGGPERRRAIAKAAARWNRWNRKEQHA